MKKLTKIKLINWHYFSNETIEVKNDILLTGANGAGKSTIIDAIQYVLTAGEQKFNLAANEYSNRELRGYVCCKLGLDDKEYLREGDVTTHVALEFFDDMDSKYFTVGVILECKKGSPEVKFMFHSSYREMKDEMFIKNGMILTISQCKENKSFENYYVTKKEARIAFRNIYGPINEKFFTLIPKALAFKPIKNVKEFIYQYLLDEKKIDVETIQDSIRMYKDLERTLKLIKRKIASLSEINTIASNIRIKNEKSTVNDLLVKLVGIEELKGKVAKLKIELKKMASNRDDQIDKIKTLDNNIRIYDENSKVLYSDLLNSESFKSKEQLQNQIERLRSELSVIENKKQKYLQAVLANNTMLDAYIDRNNYKAYKQLRGLNLKDVDEENFNDLKTKLLAINDDLNDRKEEVYEEASLSRQKKKEISRQYEQIINIIKSLEGRKMRYNPNVVSLRDSINEAFQRAGIDAEVKILAEMLEISDFSWQDAIENYLGSQRFTLIIEPQYFDFALDVFNEIKAKKQVFGVGLVNTKKMVGYDTCDAGSVAEIINSSNKYAKRYVNMVLGNVMRAKDIHDLENYSRALTKDSVVYNNYTVRQLNINIDKPFIGKDAINKQIPKYQAQERAIHADYIAIDEEIRKYEEEINFITRLNIKDIVEGMSSVIAYETQKNLIKDLSNRKIDEKSDSASDIQREYDKVTARLKSLKDELVAAHEELGRIKGGIKQTEDEIAQYEDDIINYQQIFTEIKNNNVSLENEVFEIYREDSKTMNTHELYNKYNKEQENNSRAITHLEDELKRLQLQYNNEHNFQGNLGYANMANYVGEYDKLVNSHLVEYEDKVRNAREDTERIFKEDFLAKLRSNILQAQDGVSKINKTLSEIKFGEDTYEFIFPKSKEFSGIYDMVMCDSAESNGPIITPEFELRFKDELAMLFDTLAVEEINSEGVISKFTDYRTYMDYDIRVTNVNGDTYLFSKTSGEKSGGENQVPFYVSIIASFVQIYQASRSSIGLIIFDEAFNKMDPNRIARLMEFVRPLGVQLIIATPPEKLDVITNYVDTTLIVLRQGRNSYIMPKINK
ncbi:MAG: hypothetical protein J6Y28_02480 [Acholeplasmatales bacterium]|nr:hypothetical protein [Acholeplasmatales bacterium]